MGIDSPHGELVLNLKLESLSLNLTLPGISLVILSQSLLYHSEDSQNYTDKIRHVNEST